MDKEQPTADAKSAGVNLPEGVDPQAIFEEKVQELEKLAAEQVYAASGEPSITMTEILADSKGVMAAQARELGLTAEWDEFVAKQEKIGKLREEFTAVEEKRGADANAIANVAPQLQQEAEAARKTGSVAGIVGAIGAGAASAVTMNKMNKTKKTQTIVGIIGGVVGGAIAAVMGVRSRSKKGIETIEKQFGDLSNLQTNPELEKKAADLLGQIGTAQQESIEPLVEKMALRMTEVEINELITNAAIEQEQAAKAAEAEAAKEAEKARAKEEKAAEKAEASTAPAEQPAPQQAEAKQAPAQQPVTQQASAGQGAETGHAPRSQQAGAPASPAATGSHAEALLAERAQQQVAGAGRQM
jgi:hypothetical protein